MSPSKNTGASNVLESIHKRSVVCDRVKKKKKKKTEEENDRKIGGTSSRRERSDKAEQAEDTLAAGGPGERIRGS